MFRAANPFDDLVAKATDENLTSEQWDLNLQICDRVSNAEDVGARQVVDALCRRLAAHRSANVQLLCLSLADALGKNVPASIIYPELSSRAWCAQLTRMVHDRAGVHDVVRKRLLSLIQSWAQDMRTSAASDAGNGTGAIMQETYDQLKAEHYEFTEKKVPPPKTAAEKEEEELQRVLALSLHDQGGRGPSGSPRAPASSSSDPPSHQGATYPYAAQQPLGSTPPTSSPAPRASHASAGVSVPPPVTRVRALYDFTPGEQGELGFHAGDILRVLNTVYEHWWKAELRGEIGIVPVNHLEVLPSPTAEDAARDAVEESRVFAAESTIDALVAKLSALEARVQSGQGFGPGASSLADDEELQALYQQALAVSPQVGALVERYTARTGDLRSLNDHFVAARQRFDAIVPPASVPGHAAATVPGLVPGPGQQGTQLYQTQTQAQPQVSSSQAPQASAPSVHGTETTAYEHASANANANAIPQPPPGLNPSSPEYAQWYYSVFPQAAQAQTAQ